MNLNRESAEISQLADQIVMSWPDLWFGPNSDQAKIHIAQIQYSMGKGMNLSDEDVNAVSQILTLLGPSIFRSEIEGVLFRAWNRSRNRRIKVIRAELAELERRRREEELAIQAEQAGLERRRREEEAASLYLHEQRLLTLRSTFASAFRTDFINADKIFAASAEWQYLESEFHNLKSRYLEEWFKSDALANGRPLPSLDAEQLQAIGSVDGNFQVVARAGSGKTTVSVLRAYFLIKHCGVRPSEILLLAFNRDAALEIRRRLLFLFKPEAEKLFETSRRGKLARNSENGNKTIFDIENDVVRELAEELGLELPFAMTFHALAYSIVRPEEAVLKDDPNSKDQSLSRVVQELVDDVLKDERKAKDIQDLMIRHFRSDWDLLNSEEYQMSGEDLLLWRRSLSYQAIDGSYRKSAGEKIISDFLFQHSVEYHYERNFWWGATNYKPDFTILKPGNPKAGVVIEYFGMLDDPSYVKQIERKRSFWSTQPDWTLLEIFPEDIARGTSRIEALLLPHLIDLGIPVKKLSDEEIWTIIKDAAIFQYTRLLTGFITRCRQVGWNSDYLKSKIEQHSTAKSSVEELFLKQVYYLFANYERKLEMNNETDFSALISSAVDRIQSGQMQFHRTSGNGNLAELRFITVDEFQDFSYLFDAMVKAIAHKNREIALFCVGDDWQAINGFAGSDLAYFESFVDSVPNSKRIYLSTNYRSDAAVVNLGNAIMKGHGKEAIANKPLQNLPVVGFLDDLVLTPVELLRSESDLITPALLRIIESQLKLDRDVVLLSRTNSVPYYTDSSESGIKVKDLGTFLKHLKFYFPDEIAKRISISSSHRYKGKERQTVVLIDASYGRYPLIHKDWEFSRIFGTSMDVLVEDDRRLFYVAATRAVDQLFIVSESRESLSPFVHESEYTESILKWKDYPAPATVVNPIIVQVTDVIRGSTFEIRKLLLAGGFKWLPSKKLWQKAFLAESFSLELLTSQNWASAQEYEISGRLLITVSQDPHGDIAQFEVSNGIWKTLFDVSADLEDVLPRCKD